LDKKTHYVPLVRTAAHDHRWISIEIPTKQGRQLPASSETPPAAAAASEQVDNQKKKEITQTSTKRQVRASTPNLRSQRTNANHTSTPNQQSSNVTKSKTEAQPITIKLKNKRNQSHRYAQETKASQFHHYERNDHDNNSY
jgi:hypothetical protein